MSFYLNPLMAIDFYKADHRRQYPQGTEFVYSNFTPRSAKYAQSNVLEDYDNRVVFFGLQGFIKHFLIDTWNDGFFKQDKSKVVSQYKLRMDRSLGLDAVPVEHIEALHDLGYLPIKIRALPEGSRVNIRVPMLTIINTDEHFYWLTNYLETVLSAELWKSCTTATIAYEYRRLFRKFAEMTGADEQFTLLQGHDFSCRGMSGIYDAAQASAGHLLSFIGTDTVAAIDYLIEYYGGDERTDIVGVSVPATEHSVMCMGSEDSEFDTFKRLINVVYPKGIVKYVSDTWDFWRVITDYASRLKDDILNRQINELGLAKVVFRPDSGDPVLILCGDPEAPVGTPAHVGAVECLWNIFGGTLTENGYKLLNERVGLIYGDSITLARAQAILQKLEAKGFASTNIVFGIGSFTYQHNTRDGFGFAMKATWGQVNGQGRELIKDPVTDNGVKKSAKGLLRVERQLDGSFILFDQQTALQAEGGALEMVFLNGELLRNQTLNEIRARLWSD